MIQFDEHIFQRGWDHQLVLKGWMTSVLWTKVSIRMHPENFEGIQTSSEAVILPKAQISHDQKHRKGSFLEGTWDLLFSGTSRLVKYYILARWIARNVEQIFQQIGVLGMNFGFVIEKMITLPQTNMTPENEWLEYWFPFGMAYFQVLC